MDSSRFVHRRKPDIPVFGPRAPDKKQHIQEVSVKSIELSKVIRLLEDPLTVNLKERHLFVLKKLLKRCQIGFLLKELTGIAKILNICAEKVTDHPEYLPIFCEALHICRLPFLKEKSSDELNYAQDVIEFLSHMGCLMRVSDAEVRQHIVESVKSFYSSVAPKLLPDVTWLRLLLLSMAALENQPGIKLQLLQTLQILSSSSGGAETICLHMNQPDPNGQVLFHSSEILWNLLERGSTEVTAQLSSMECVISLKEAFLHQLINGFRHSDLQLRNDLLVITTLIAGNPNSLLIESLFAKQLVVYATFPELKSHNPLVSNLKLSYNNEDLKMKKMLLNLLVLMSKDLAALQLYKEEREEVQLQALATLCSLAPIMLEDYMSCQGNAVLLLLLDWCGPSSPVAEGRGRRKAQMRHCIRVLRSVTSSGEESVNQDLCDQGTINQLLGILMQMEASPDEDDLVSLEIKSDIQLILSALCERDMHRKELFGSEGVEMAVHFLKKGSDKFYSGLGHNKLILSTVDCVWSCIVGCYTTEDYFLAKEGASLLMDLLSSSPRCLHCNVLASLLELCDNPNALSHILSWRDSRGQTAPRFLLQLWMDEEEELKVSRDQDGGIADPQRPILGVYQQEDPQLSFPANVPSAAVLELSENLRSKVYSIFCKLGFHDLPGLSRKHYVALSVVRRYLDFKVGEVWEEVSRELGLDGVRPTTPDEEALSAVCKISEDTARKVAAEQRSILELQEKEDISEEQLMYTEIKSHWKQKELTAKSWDSYVSRTSNYEILKEVKAQREEYIESSRPKPEHEEAAVHPAELILGKVMSVERTGSSGPAGVKLTLARTSIKASGQDQAAPTTQDPEYFSTVKD
ncbi:hypothetical protein KUCAC02_011259 [Chaenocephalus aceratus]|uniref:Uncharacterized protein n=1 Tax=Chaenocephalus aceratus TaxID=36190 RepID=A0ACB9WW69_CHAAC|nr:hypothetical protein KUCAC02_011259 [Chaenocephalus aceratus]